MSPPISRASWRESARPSPVPSFDFRPVSVCTNGSKSWPSSSGAMPGPVSSTSNTRAVLRPPRAQRDAAALGELDRVAEQVDQDLPQLALVARHRAGQVGGQVGPQHEVPGLGAHADHLLEAAQERRQVERGFVEGDAPGLDLREREHVVDEAEQVLAAPQDGAEVLAVARRTRSRVALHELGEAEDGVERRAQLVAHVGEEDALGAVRLLRGLARAAPPRRAPPRARLLPRAGSACAPPRRPPAARSRTRSCHTRARYAPMSAARTRSTASSLEPACLVEARLHRERERRTFLVPQAVVVGRDHTEAVLAVRDLRVVRRPPRPRLDPALVEALQPVLEPHLRRVRAG